MRDCKNFRGLVRNEEVDIEVRMRGGIEGFVDGMCRGDIKECICFIL